MVGYSKKIPENAKIKFYTILRKNEKWYACISYEIPDVLRRKDLGEPLGIDVGLMSLLTTSEGEHEENPRYYQKSQEKIAKQQQKLRRKEKFSNNWKKQQLKIARIYEKVTNQREDNLHKISRKLVDKYPYIKVENLTIQNMIQNGRYSKSIADASWGKLFEMLDYKVEEAGGLVEYVDPRGTSQVCTCGYPVPKELWDRIHICPNCGLVKDRDEVSADVIIQRDGTSRLACGEKRAQAVSKKQEVQL